MSEQPINRVNKEKIIEDLAIKYRLSEQQVADVVNSQWKFLVIIMEKGQFDGVQIPRFGKWFVKLARLSKLQLRRNINLDIDKIFGTKIVKTKKHIV